MSTQTRKPDHDVGCIRFVDLEKLSVIHHHLDDFLDIVGFARVIRDDGIQTFFHAQRVVNVGHGAFIMVGAFTALMLFNVFAINPILAVPCLEVTVTQSMIPRHGIFVRKKWWPKDETFIEFWTSLMG